MSNETAAVNAAPFNERDERQRRYEAMQFAVAVRGPMGDTGKVMEAAEKFLQFLVGEDTAKTEDITEAPTEPGFYKYSGGNQNILFLLDPHGAWFAWFDNGDTFPCEWGYIEQALGVWDLERIA